MQPITQSNHTENGRDQLQSMTDSNPLINGISSESQKRKIDDDDEISLPSKRARIATMMKYHCQKGRVSKSSFVFALFHLQSEWIVIVFVW